MQRANGSAACASCKHQRKKCTEKCILAPFFPVEKSREFHAVHKVFGVSKVAKMLKNLNHEDRKKATDSMIWEACCRERDPIQGPYGDYIRVFEELKLYKNQFLKTNHQAIINPAQGSMVYKGAAAPVLVGWDNNNINNKAMNINTNGGGGIGGGGGINRSGGLICIRDHNGSSAIDSCPYNYAVDDSAIILPQHHSSTTTFNHQFFVEGQYNSTDTKTAERSLWEVNS